jgi:hypothetical protein
MAYPALSWWHKPTTLMRLWRWMAAQMRCHRIGEVDQPGFRAECFHIPGNFQNRQNIAGSVGKTARPAVFSIGLADAIFEGDAIIRFP